MQELLPIFICNNTRPFGLLNAIQRNPTFQYNRLSVGTALHMSRHNVHLIESFRAIGAFSHAVCNAVLHAVVAEKMSARLEDCVLEVLPTDSAKCKSLQVLVTAPRSWNGNIL